MAGNQRKRKEPEDGRSTKPQGEPRKHYIAVEDPRLGLKGVGKDKDQPVRPTLCDFNAEEIGKVVQNEIAYQLPQAKQESLKEQTGSRSLAELFRFYVNAKEIGKSLKKIAETTRDHLDYQVQAFLSRQKAATAYRVLIEVIGALGPLPESVPSMPAERHKELVQDALKAFAGVFQPSCEVGYFRNRMLNRTELLYERNTLFPEAMYGFSWAHDIATKVLLDESPQLLYPPFPTETGYAKPGRFGVWKFPQREEVDGKRVIGFRLSWAQTSVALFLNWRNNDGAAKLLARFPEIWVKFDNAYGEYENALSRLRQERPYRETSWRNLREKLRQALGAELQSFEIAVGYLIGWLSASKLDLYNLQDKTSSIVNPSQLVSDVEAAASTELPADQAQRLKSAVTAALEESGYYCDVLWVETIPDADGRSCPHLIYPAEYRRGTAEGAVGAGGETGVRIKLDLDTEEKLVPANTGICHQAAKWQTGLLIQDFNRIIVPDGTRTWNDLYISRVDSRSVGWRCTAEIALPIFGPDNAPGGPNAAERVIGVVNIERNGKLTAEHLHRAELVVFLFQRLRALHHWAAQLPTTSDRRARAGVLMSDLLRAPSHFNFQSVCKRYCEWVREELTADLVHLSIYDSRRDVFRPMGVTASVDLVKKFLKKEGLNLGRTSNGLEILAEELYEAARMGSSDRNPPEGPRSWNLGRNERAAIKEAVHALIEHVIATRLIPSRRGTTWDIFTKKIDAQYTPQLSRNLVRSFGDYVKTRLGLPFCPNDDAQAEGVLWVSWSQKPTERDLPALAPFLGDGDALKEQIQQQLQPVSEVVAGLHALYRYFVPDRTYDPNPPPSGR